MRHPSPASRDAALHNVSRITRWTIAGSVALTAGFGGLAAKSFSGKKHATSTTSTTREGSESTSGSSGQSSGSQSSSDNSDQQQLQAPYNAPSSSSGSGQVSSGGS